MDANKATGEAEQNKTEADKLKKNSDDKAKAANDAKAALDKAEQKISDKTVLKGIYEDKAKTMAAEADQAQKTADAFKQSLKDKPTDAEKQEANDLQKKADIKKAEADALKKYGEAVNTSNKPN
jgi:hypothetical protein